MNPREAFAIVIAMAIGVGCARTGDHDSQAAELEQGKFVYTENCASCHGDAGDGQGQAAYVLFPKPRNFLKSEFKLRSTPQEMLPTDDDVLRTVTQGIPGTGMFAFGDLLSEPDRKAVVQYVKFLTPRFKGAPPIAQADLLEIPNRPEPTPRLLALGRTTYEKFGCGKCHGPQGKGDGPSAPTLVDSSGDPFPAADFSQGIYKSGGQPGDLYRTFLTGMDGTPMPSFQQALTSDEEAWALVYYTLSFAPGGKAAPIAGDEGPLEAVAVSDTSVVSDPDSPAWSTIEPHHVYLRPLWYRNDYPLWVLVRAARVGDRIALMAEWQDRTHNMGLDREQDFADGVALQFALTDRLPFIAMGDRASQGLCEIWHWRADRQLARDKGQPAKRSDAYPHMPEEIYPLPDFTPPRDVGNLLADSGAAGRPVHTLTAKGMGTLTARFPSSQRVEGHGRWKDGIYRVVFSTTLMPSDASREADFTRATVPVAFAIWDGAAGDRNGTKLVSQWLMLAPGAGPVAISQRRSQ